MNTFKYIFMSWSLLKTPYTIDDLNNTELMPDSASEIILQWQVGVQWTVCHSYHSPVAIEPAKPDELPAAGPSEDITPVPLAVSISQFHSRFAENSLNLLSTDRRNLQIALVERLTTSWQARHAPYGLTA